MYVDLKSNTRQTCGDLSLTAPTAKTILVINLAHTFLEQFATYGEGKIP